MSKHTPGPWLVGLKCPDGTVTIITPASDIYHRVATVEELDQSAEANAHLIAAAPELLEAAKIVVGRADVISGCDPKEYGKLLADALILLSHAIYKAEGRQP